MEGGACREWLMHCQLVTFNLELFIGVNEEFGALGVVPAVLGWFSGKIISNPATHI
jgi:hypothetical protein